MPEEINRLATDAITDVFFTTEKQGTCNLLLEGRPENTVHFVGNVMIDNLFYQLDKLEHAGPSPEIRLFKKKLAQKYACLTLHRPCNVDKAENFGPIVSALRDISLKIPVVFPCHPRTRFKLEEFGLIKGLLTPKELSAPINQGIILFPPLGYNDFLYLWKDAAMVLTDSGGLQEETTSLKIPCLTLRENTERPITIEVGSNLLIGRDMDLLRTSVADILANGPKASTVPELWDGKASQRIAQILSAWPGNK
jgi:UDP-N-acetylglucosamine 2-epimerase (non-hydrolysing)